MRFLPVVMLGMLLVAAQECVISEQTLKDILDKLKI